MALINLFFTRVVNHWVIVQGTMARESAQPGRKGLNHLNHWSRLGLTLKPGHETERG